MSFQVLPRQHNSYRRMMMLATLFGLLGLAAINVFVSLTTTTVKLRTTTATTSLPKTTRTTPVSKVVTYSRDLTVTYTSDTMVPQQQQQQEQQQQKQEQRQEELKQEQQQQATINQQQDKIVLDHTSFSVEGSNSNAGADNSTAMITALSPRVWSTWWEKQKDRSDHQHQLPCFPSHRDILSISGFQDATFATQGFLYMKPRKCASTTVASVNLRVARNVAKRHLLSMSSNSNTDSRGSLSNLSSSSTFIPPSLSSSPEEELWQPARGAKGDVLCDNRFSHGDGVSLRPPPPAAAVNETQGVEISTRYLPKRPPGPTFAGRFLLRNRTQSFLWTVIREPTARYISHYYYQKATAAVGGKTKTTKQSQSRNNNKIKEEEDDDDIAFQKWLVANKHNSPHYYLCTLSPHRNDYERPRRHISCRPTGWDVARNQPKLTIITQNNTNKTSDDEDNHRHPFLSLREWKDLQQLISVDYDFIGTVERLDESLVVLKELLGLPLADVLYLNAKIGGETLVPLFSKNGHTCERAPSSSQPLSSAMKRFFASDEWQRHIVSDTLLYQAVNRSLDETIQSLSLSSNGERRSEDDWFSNQIQLLRRANQRAQETCSNTITWPCQRKGQKPLHERKTDCYIRDLGCGMTCLDQIATEMNLW